VPKILQLAQSAPTRPERPPGVAGSIGGLDAVPVLVAAAADNDSELAATAQATLARFRDTNLDADLLSRLPNAAGKNRQVLIGLAGSAASRAPSRCLCRAPKMLMRGFAAPPWRPSELWARAPPGT